MNSMSNSLSVASDSNNSSGKVSVTKSWAELIGDPTKARPNYSRDEMCKDVAELEMKYGKVNDMNKASLYLIYRRLRLNEKDRYLTWTEYCNGYYPQLEGSNKPIDVHEEHVKDDKTKFLWRGF